MSRSLHTVTTLAGGQNAPSNDTTTYDNPSFYNLTTNKEYFYG